ncbi:hypothetical protein [Williamsia phyllosphaerae]|uniref:hypothetical protein n=1 Tax=Williamsia phyllosphaerae TaxID=885042 RepID=UPI0016649604|nr:hypothetical protein [Williamsia phyllosphaerae]
MIVALYDRLAACDTTAAHDWYQKALDSSANAMGREFIRNRMDEMWSLGDSNS